MATQTLRPDVFVRERNTITPRVEGVSTSVTSFMGIAQSGPVNKPVRVIGIREFEKIFGTPVEGESLYHAVKGFFSNGGQSAWIVRLAHYTDLASATLQSTPSSYDAQGVGAAAFAQFTGNADVSSIAVEDGESLTFDVDGSGAQSPTFQAVAAVVLGSGGTFPAGGANDTASYRVNGGVTKSIDLSSVGTGVAAYVDALNAQMEGVQVTENGGEIEITTDRKGSGASIELLSFGATFAASTGLAVGTTASAGPNNVSDADAVTFAEIKAVIEAAVFDSTPGDKIVATQDASNFLVLSSVFGTAGVGSTIDLTAGDADLILALGLSSLGSQGANPVATGSAAAAATAFIFKSGFKGDISPGLAGNDLEIEILDDPKFISSGLGLDLAGPATAGDQAINLTSSAGILPQSVLAIVEGGTTEYAIVRNVNRVVVGATVQHQVQLSAPLTNSFTTGGTAVNSVESTVVIYRDGLEIERRAQLSPNPNAQNYLAADINDQLTGMEFVTVEDQGLLFPANVLVAVSATAMTGGTSETNGFTVNDIIGLESSKLGFFALDEIQDLSLVVVPPSHGTSTTIPANAAVHNASLNYTEARQDSFSILDMPGALTAEQAKVYRQNTLGADSEWGAIYWPHLEVVDPFGVGTNPTIFIPPSGHVAGLYARVTNIDPPDGGVASSPAGRDEFGKLEGIVGLQTLPDDKNNDLLNPVGVNVIRQLRRGGAAAPGIVVNGARTLSTDILRRYINGRRTKTFVGQSLKIDFRQFLFRNNDARLRRRLENRGRQFLREMLATGQLQGTSEEEAFFIRADASINTPDVVNLGQLIVEVGLALQKPAEFIIIQLSQLQNQGEQSIQEV